MLMVLMVFRPHGLLTSETTAPAEEPDFPPAPA
jgi:hypothetical protein